jgi:hypothetical protein
MDDRSSIDAFVNTMEGDAGFTLSTQQWPDGGRHATVGGEPGKMHIEEPATSEFGRAQDTVELDREEPEPRDGLYFFESPDGDPAASGVEPE